jgi:hypothetical protein
LAHRNGSLTASLPISSEAGRHGGHGKKWCGNFPGATQMLEKKAITC